MLLAALIAWGQIDLKVLAGLAKTPGIVLLCVGLIFLTVPLGALRWGLILRALNLSLPFNNLFHFFAIATATNLVLFGPAGGDVLRGVLAWRALGGNSGRVAISIAADRALGLLALLTIAVVTLALNWQWAWSVPPLAMLGTVLILSCLAAAAGLAAIFFAPGVMQALVARLSAWPRLARLMMQLQAITEMVRSNPGALLAAFGLSLAIQTMALLGVLVIASAVNVGSLTLTDYLIASPLAFVANAIPLTPNGLGVGEAAFDQICHWIEQVPTDAAYSSIFFAYRAAAFLGSLGGLISFAFYRERSRAGQPAN
jgi:uncharacterized protein (TIRG00374 family)